MSNVSASNRAWSLLFEDVIFENDNLFSQGSLKNVEGCTRTIEGVDRSIHLTTGRFSKTSLKVVSDQEEIPKISNSCRLVEMTLFSAYTIGGNKSYNNTLAIFRPKAYI